MKTEKRVSKTGRVYYNTYVKKVWERKTEHILSKKGKYYKRHIKPPFIPTGIDINRGVCKERDSYACQLCGGKQNIDAHHRDNLGLHLVGDKGANNDLDNLVSLCHRCHLRLHYGVLAKHKEIIRLRLSGLTLQEIATKFGVSRQRIHQILIKNSFDPRLAKT